MEILQESFTWADLWPELACLSCWTHGSSELWIASLQDRLGPVPLQGKGLLSTECFVSFPFATGLDPVLAYRSHFFEFREEADGLQGSIVPMEGLRLSGVYEVIVTTGGGLCRYPTGDLVQITSMASGLPSLRFLRRREGWTDMAGEKVSESAALAALQDLRREAYPEIMGGALVACAEVPGGPRYRLHLEWKGNASQPNTGRSYAVASAMEKRLDANPYYRLARGLGQLEKLEVTDLERGSMEKLLDRYKREKKVADGNVKLPFLFDNRDWQRLGEEHASVL